MAFFEQIGKKISDASQGISQQTKNMTDVMRLNNTISEKRKQIAASFSALGENYYNQHRDDPAAEQPELIQAINALNAEIHQCEEEIKTIKGVTKCPNCGADVPLNAGFCSACGAPVPQSPPPQPAPQAPAMRECPNCHRPVPAGSKFCTGCGTRLGD